MGKPFKTFVKAIEDDTGIIVKYRVGEEIVFEKINFLNYFFISNFDVERIPESAFQFIRKIEENNIFDGFSTIYLNQNSERNLLFFIIKKENIEVYEGDVNAVKRWLVSNQKIDLNPAGLKWVFFDIETKDDGLFEFDLKGDVVAHEPILSVSFKDYSGTTIFLKNENKNDILAGEKILLKKMKNVLESYDVVSAWNGHHFDIPYIVQRRGFHGLNNNFLFFLNKMDFMEMFRKNVIGLESYALNSVSKVFLDCEKIDLGGGVGKGTIFKNWQKSFEGDDLLQKYNENDVDLMFKLEKKMKLFEIHKKEAELGHCEIQETMNNSTICDYLLLNKFFERKIISPSKPSTDERDVRMKKRILGAEVFCENSGVFENVEVFDFKSFYPSAIAMCNICVTTILKNPEEGCVVIPENTLKRKGEDVVAETKYFSTKKVGVISEVARWLIASRDEVKYKKFDFIKSNPTKFKEMEIYEKSIKIVANSLYGALSFVNFRYYDFDVASAVTQFCREIINRSKMFAESKGYKVIQGDTDSIFFTGGDRKQLEEDFKIKFDEWAEEMRIKNHLIVFEWEKTFHRLICVMKKNYAGILEKIDGDGNPTGVFETKIVGLECRKRDTNPLAKELQFELIEKILYKKFDEKEFSKKLLGIKNAVENNSIDPKYLIMKKSLTKKVEDFGKPMIDGVTGVQKLKKNGEPRFAPIPAHIVLVKRLISEGKEFFVGDNIEYIVESEKPRIKAITVEEYLDGAEYAHNYYLKRIMTPVEKILKVIE